MNDAKLQLDKGNLSAAIESAINLVKTNPTNEAARIFLFENFFARAADPDREQKTRNCSSEK